MQLQMLAEFKQLHLLDGWDFSEEAKIAGFFAQLQVLDSNYPDGLGAYIINARKLLRDSAAGANPLGGFTPEVYVPLLMRSHSLLPGRQTAAAAAAAAAAAGEVGRLCHQTTHSVGG